MGLGNDLLVLIGILPMPKYDFDKKRRDKTLEKTNYEKLEELNGKFVWVQDFHHGIRYGKLKYNSPNSERYYIVNSGQEFPFHVSDLESIGANSSLD